jgi:hypothetical protein
MMIATCFGILLFVIYYLKDKLIFLICEKSKYKKRRKSWLSYAALRCKAVLLICLS